MTQISEQVKSFLENDFIIRKCLFRNILSLRALSRHIIKELELKESNMDAVISAIRRYKRAEKSEMDVKTKRLFSKVAVKTKSNIVDIRVQKNKRSVENI